METKQDMIQWLDHNQRRFTRLSDEIWAHPEVAYQEFVSSKLQADLLLEEEFRITWDIGDINTAFVAEWGSGGPILGFLGEYDALPGLSQRNQPTQEPLVEGAPGHACGHNLLGVGCVASVVALKRWLDSTSTPGTVRYYGCPAEERVSGKTFMARAGAFDDLDAALTFHPSSMNAPSKGSSVGIVDLTFRFHGHAAHAGGSPHKGRSALDAVELMNVGVNYMREHIAEKVRIHYTITHGGDAPNIVPAEAEVWYYVRAHQREELSQVVERVRKVAQGAALMTGTTVEETFNGACSSLLNNHYLADLHHEAMQLVGPLQFTEQEKEYAARINEAYPEENARNPFEHLRVPEEMREHVKALKGQPLLEENFPAWNEEHVGTGSTDVGDVSWITPLSELGTTCFATGAAGHSWGIVATGATSIGHKGMMHAAKIMAIAAMDLYTDSQHLQRARQEFELSTQERAYETPLPDHVKPPRHRNSARGVD